MPSCLPSAEALSREPSPARWPRACLFLWRFRRRRVRPHQVPFLVWIRNSIKQFDRFSKQVQIHGTSIDKRQEAPVALVPASQTSIGEDPSFQFSGARRGTIVGGMGGGRCVRFCGESMSLGMRDCPWRWLSCAPPEFPVSEIPGSPDRAARLVSRPSTPFKSSDCVGWGAGQPRVRRVSESFKDLELGRKSP